MTENKTAALPPLSREDAIDLIDDLRAGMTYADSQNMVLIDIVRNLWDGYALADTHRAATVLFLADRRAERAVKAVVARLPQRDDRNR